MYTVDESEYLEHYGRKGIKWGSHIFGLEKKVGSGIRKSARKVKRKIEREKAYDKKQKALRKQQRKEAQVNPYGQGRHKTANQRNRESRDETRYGEKGVKRIKESMAKGHSYNSAVRIERGKRALATVGLYAAANFAVLDLESGGALHRGAAKAAKGIGKAVVSKVSSSKAAKVGAEMVFDVASKKWVRA